MPDDDAPPDPPDLRTDRLALSAWRAEEADVVLDLYSRIEVVRWAGGPDSALATLDEARERLGRWRTRAAGGPPRGIWAIRPLASGRPVGTALLVDLPASSEDGSRPPSGHLEIGWHLHPDAWGRGWATEAATAVLAHAAAHGVGEVLAVTHPDNRPSQAVARRIGMRHLGRSREFYDTEVELFSVRPDPRSPREPAGPTMNEAARAPTTSTAQGTSIDSTSARE